jgi:hypothetical protein
MAMLVAVAVAVVVLFSERAASISSINSSFDCTHFVRSLLIAAGFLNADDRAGVIVGVSIGDISGSSSFSSFSSSSRAVSCRTPPPSSSESIDLILSLIEDGMAATNCAKCSAAT